MLVYFVVIDSALVCLVTSLAHCKTRFGQAPYISEFMLQCLEGPSTWLLPWACAGTFAALVFVQLAWMHAVAVAWRTLQAGAARAPWKDAVLFWCPAWAAVLGFGCVVAFAWRDASAAEQWAHRVGVVLLAAGSFACLQLVWGALRAGDNARLLRGGRAPGVPCLSWVEFDVAFLVVLAVFMATTLLNALPLVSAACEYGAFALLLAQTTWLLVLCLERAAALARRVSAELAPAFGEAAAAAAFGAECEADPEARPVDSGHLLVGLLCLFSFEVAVVLVAVL